MKPQKCLLVIDMQKGSFTPDTPRYETDSIVKKINSLASMFRKNSWLVAFVQHNGSSMDEFIPNTSDWELLDDLEVHEQDLMVEKFANDVFYNTSLHAKLKELNVNELVITGCATDFCVESTIQSALVKDFDILVVEDGHTTGNRPFMDAEQVINHYNWVWKNMTPTKGKIDVWPYSTVMTLHEQEIDQS
ncbi:cysteine hydrolase family protein [Dyadobacter sp. CY326]|uniref:cysteine hydrolase family protein n=1 Tax=Dyadobacter sp. CY326 TaxID=2907300 RepID=UPI001F40EF8A|nr:cysteine hydrolase family protein [Dyadobacter sp. CY326]MCE7067433.1 cysteine hydrolase [Dyadobacter sp. CY326]